LLRTFVFDEARKFKLDGFENIGLENRVKGMTDETEIDNGVLPTATHMYIPGKYPMEDFNWKRIHGRRMMF